MKELITHVACVIGYFFGLAAMSALVAFAALWFFYWVSLWPWPDFVKGG